MYTNISHQLFDYKYLWEFIATEHKFKSRFCTQKPVLSVHFKDFWILAQIWYDKFNKLKALKVKHSLHTQHYFLIFNNYYLNSPNQIWVNNILKLVLIPVVIGSIPVTAEGNVITERIENITNGFIFCHNITRYFRRLKH